PLTGRGADQQLVVLVDRGDAHAFAGGERECALPRGLLAPGLGGTRDHPRTEASAAEIVAAVAAKSAREIAAVGREASEALLRTEAAGGRLFQRRKARCHRAGRILLVAGAVAEQFVEMLGEIRRL